MNLVETLKGILQKIDREIPNGITKNVKSALQVVFEMVKADPLLLYHDKDAFLLAKSLMYYLVYDLSEDEDQLILAAHLSFFYFRTAQKQVETDEQLMQVNRNAVILVGEFADYFRHTVAMCYRGKSQTPSQEEFQRSLTIADMRTPLLEFLLLEEINAVVKDYNDDEFLIQRENALFSEATIEDFDISEAQKLDSVLYGYIAKKIELDDLVF